MNKKILLEENEIPSYWYNILSDIPTPIDPPLGPDGKPITPDALTPIFPMKLIEQEVSTQAEIPIPEEVRRYYAYWRPTPLVRAYGLEKALETPAKIYFKNESVSPAGSHKPNTSVPQAYYNKLEGIKRLSTETGAGQWGSALAFACGLVGLDCTVYMVKVSFQQKPYRASMIRAWGASIFPSPSEQTSVGREFLKKDPNSSGSLGIAISEATEDAATHNDTHYSLGSVLNHVLLHQSVIGLEAKKQFEKIGEYPDVVLAPCGGGSNLGGISFPFYRDKFAGKQVRIVAVEPKSCPTLTRGAFKYDFGDSAGMTPLIKMFTLGHNYAPPSIHAGGLRYHGDSPIVSALVKNGLMEAISVNQLETFEAALLFAKTEGIIPAPESAHAIRGAIIEAMRAKEEGKEKTILFNLSGHGHFDMTAYDDYLAGKLSNYEVTDQQIKKSLSLSEV